MNDSVGSAHSARQILVDRDLQMPITLDEADHIAAAWILFQYATDQDKAAGTNMQVLERLGDLIANEPHDAWQVIEAIRRMDGGDFILSNLAAGPVENLLVAHGSEFIGMLEASTPADSQLRKLLGAVWQNAMPDDIWRRLQAIAGPSR